MRYMGSKARIARDILPIMLANRSEDQYYVEPFCGGCNTIDKVPGLRIANDVNNYLIEMFKALTTGWDPPITISKDCYEVARSCYKWDLDYYPTHLIGWVGFIASFNGKFFAGYTGHECHGKGGPRDYIGENTRNILKQIPSLNGVTFESQDYSELVIPEKSIIYCDPPYMNTTKYQYSVDHSRLWDWCRKMVFRGCEVFVSEYNAPDDFVCAWEKKVSSGVSPGGSATKKVEKLFIHKSRVRKK